MIHQNENGRYYIEVTGMKGTNPLNQTFVKTDCSDGGWMTLHEEEATTWKTEAGARRWLTRRGIR